MDDFIPLSMLNDYIFCPYSIYIHNVYANTDEEVYHALPQIRGRQAHHSIDRKIPKGKGIITSLPVFSEELRIQGIIDEFQMENKLLIERKYQLTKIYKGQLYQIWGEYFCMTEMGYIVENLAFYENAHNRMIPIPLPQDKEKEEMRQLLIEIRNFDIERLTLINENKCKHCIYCRLCDKIDIENVYE